VKKRREEKRDGRWNGLTPAFGETCSLVEAERFVKMIHHCEKVHNNMNLFFPFL